MTGGILLLFLLLLSPLYEASNGPGSFLHARHYDTVEYDSNQLLRQHYKLRRANEGGPDQHIKLSFSTHGRDFDLRLHPEDSHYFHKDFELVVDGVSQSRSNLLSYLYVGYDANDPDSTVHGSLAYGVFDGAIHTGDDIYHIEPANRYINNSRIHSIAYKHSDLLLIGGAGDEHHHHHHTGSTCGVSDQRKRLFLSRMQTASHHVTKRQSSNPSKVSCWINIVADHLFYEGVTKSGVNQNTRVAQASSLIRNFVASTSNIYRAEDFNGDGTPDGINFAIQKITINTSAPSDNQYFANEFLGVETLLSEFSRADWSDFCLSYLFTNRDFEGGVLGLAFVANPSRSGGICDNYSGGKTLNTGVVTMVNYGFRVSNAAATLTFAHETGHNFGSEHDSGSCSPSDNPYIMTAFANDGSRSNNDNFSPCSITMMRRIISSKGQNQNGCFRESTDLCGNYLLDEGEECDCGVDHTNGICNSDHCCNATSCKLVSSPNVHCSPQSSGCCYNNCTIIPAGGHICSDETDCAYEQACNGSAQCPRPIAKESSNGSLPCNSGSNYCVNGECTGSICIPLQLPDCECFSNEEACHICCSVEGACTSTFTLSRNNQTARELLPNGEGKILGVGYPCKNFTGYCDFYDKCRLVLKQGALARITGFFTSSEVLIAFEYVRQYWWAGVVGAVTLLVVLFLVVLGCHCILPRPEHMKKRLQRRKDISKSRGRQSMAMHRRHNRTHANSHWIDTSTTM